MRKLTFDRGTPVQTWAPIIETDVFDQEELDTFIEVARNKKLRHTEAAV